MSTESTFDEKEEFKKAEKLGMREGSAYSVMDGFGLRYITPYALAMGATNFYIGILSSLPALIGNLFQLPILRLMKKSSRKKIVVSSVFLQAILWLPIIAVGFFYFVFGMPSKISIILLILFYTLMIISGTASNPVWNSWMNDIIRKNKGEYFGKRNKLMGIIAMLSMLAAGFILNYFDSSYLFAGFLIIFFLAFAGRIASSIIQSRKYEPKLNYEKEAYFSLADFSKRMWFNNFGKFVIFVSLISFATGMAGPFFAVYMLDDLGLSYFSFTLINISATLTTIVFMPLWGKFADKFGNVKVLKITGYLIPLVPLLWVLCPLLFGLNIIFLVGYLMLVEMFSGFAWAGFNLSAGNFAFDAVTRQRMALCVSYFNIFNSFGSFLGALIGGFIASQNLHIAGMSAILIVFILSGVLRFLISIIMNPMIKEVRPVPDFKVKNHLKEKLKEIEINSLRYIGFKPIKTPYQEQ